ncbi:MAG: aromatic amino acid lyase [Pseudonocardia sp.]|nr:aromatic amino acid lyase [Pseudonocardia sp.]
MSTPASPSRQSITTTLSEPVDRAYEGTEALTIDGWALAPAQVAEFAHRHGATARLDPCARARMLSSVRMRERLLDAGERVYGMTTGFGDSVRRSVSPEHAAILQRNLILGHLCGSGPPACREVTRATMLIRANCLARGHSGIRPKVVELLLALLQRDLTPVVPSRGSLGASGDLIPLAYVAATLLGQGTIDHENTHVPASEALRAHGLEPIVLEAREGLALINGTAFSAGFAVVALAAARRLAHAADAATALAVAALHGNPDHFDERLHRHKGHTGQQHSASGIRATLRGLVLARASTLQDPYSLRCAPHVIGVLHDTLDWAETWLRTEVNSSTDNPLFDPAVPNAMHGGHFYAGHIGHAMESVKLAVANVADLLDRQVELLVDEKFNRGLTPNLVTHHPDRPARAGDETHALEDGHASARDDPAVHHGMKASQIACSALTAETLQAAMPAMVFSRSSEAHNQDKVSMGTTAARQALEVCRGATGVLAIQLLAACQALDVRGTPLGNSTVARLHATIRARVPVLRADRRLDDAQDAVRTMIEAGLITPPSDTGGCDRGSPI